jgi:exonuclease SbcD
VLAEVNKGKTNWEFIPLKTRPFLDLRVTLENAETVMDDIICRLPPSEQVKGAIIRLQLTYPADWEALIDDASIQRALQPALEARIVKNRLTETRARLGDTAAVETLTPAELLELYWKTTEMDEGEATQLQLLGADIIASVNESGS